MYAGHERKVTKTKDAGCRPFMSAGAGQASQKMILEDECQS